MNLRGARSWKGVERMSEKRYIGFHHGALCPSYEEQANEQGFTLGDKAKLFDKIAYSYNLLWIHGFLTDNQADNVCKKIQKKLVASVKPIEGSGENEN